MNAVKGERVAETRSFPLSGVGIVFLRQMRCRCAWRDLLWSGLLLATALGLAAALQAVWTQEIVPESGATSDFLLRGLTLGVAFLAILALPCAAALGAGAVPSSAEFEPTQAALLTRLTAFDIAAGRLLAALWPLFASLLASCAFWLTAQLIRHFVPGAARGFGPIFVAHIVALLGVYMVGAVGFLFAERRRPGRAWARGAAVALFLAAFGVTALFLANPLILRMNRPTTLIEGALVINPVVAVTTAFDQDILRQPWIYDRTAAPEYPFAYPSPLASACLFALVGAGAQALSAARLRRAYR